MDDSASVRLEMVKEKVKLLQLAVESGAPDPLATATLWATWAMGETPKESPMDALVKRYGTE